MKPLDPSIKPVGSMAVLSIVIGPEIKKKKKLKFRGRSRYISVLLRDRSGKPFTCTLFSLSLVRSVMSAGLSGEVRRSARCSTANH